MANRARTGLLLSLIVCAAGAPASAQSNLTGLDLGWQYYAGGGPLAASVSGSVTGGTFVDDGGIGGTFIAPDNTGALPVFNIDANATSITFDYSISTPSLWTASPLSLTPTIYNGVAINLLSPGHIYNVWVDPATNMVGFDASKISYTADQIQVDWQGLAFNTSTVVTLDVSTTPEPGTFGLALLILAPAALVWRRRSRLRGTASGDSAAV